MDDEEWRPIPGYEVLYDASNLGRIRSHHRGGKIKQPIRTSDGYLLTFLHAGNGTRRGHNVHRLICMAFHGPPPLPDMEAAHLDGDQLNNVPSNLAWTTRLQNIRHKVVHGTTRPGEEHPKALLTEALAREAWTSKESAESLASRAGVSQSAIEDVRRGKNWRQATKDLPPQPKRPRGGSFAQPTPPPPGFAEAAAMRPHWRQLADQFGMSKPTVYRYLAKLRGSKLR